MASNPVEQAEQLPVASGSTDSADSAPTLLRQFFLTRNDFETDLHNLLIRDMNECEERDNEAFMAAENARREQDEKRRAKMVREGCKNFQYLWQMKLKTCYDGQGAKEKVERALEELLEMGNDFNELQKELGLLQEDVRQHEHVQVQRLCIQKQQHWQRTRHAQQLEAFGLVMQPRTTRHTRMMLRSLHYKQQQQQQHRGFCFLHMADNFIEVCKAVVAFINTRMRKQLQQEAELWEKVERLLVQNVENVDKMLADREKDFQERRRKDHADAMNIVNHWRCGG